LTIRKVAAVTAVAAAVPDETGVVHPSIPPRRVIQTHDDIHPMVERHDSEREVFAVAVVAAVVVVVTMPAVASS
jgi:hypothetical protein